ncbi:hypothetical protein JTB14_000434 [Gonioctena quinquepunctata]|nr:hypothetical protein JTB14_000434 [Gonioctena quinquepunctata]
MDIHGIEFIDLSGVEASEQTRIRTSLQQYDPSVQLPWVKPNKKPASAEEQPQKKNETLINQDQNAAPLPVAVSHQYDYFQHPMMSPTLYCNQQSSVMVQPILTYQHPQSNVIYYANAVSPMSPPYPVFVQHNTGIHGYTANNSYNYQETVEEHLENAVEEELQNGDPEPEIFQDQPKSIASPALEPPQLPEPSIPNGFAETSPSPANKSWASLFNSGKSNNISHVDENLRNIASDQAVNKESNNNELICPIKHPRKSQQFVDPDCYRMGEFLTLYSIDGKAVSLQPRGLLNQSNYCYINSILQALIACPPLYNLLCSLGQNISSNEKRKPTPVIDGMCRFVKEFDHLPPNMRMKDRRVDKNAKKDQSTIINTGIPFEPTWIYKMLITMRTDLIEGRQEDAEEFLGFLLNGLNDEMFELMKLVKSDSDYQQPAATQVNEIDANEEWQVMGSKNKGSVTRRTDFARTPISDIFGGLLKSKIHRTGDLATENIQPFLTLQLNIEKVKTVREALEAIITKNQLEGLTSSKTNEEVEAWQQVMLDELPVILILHLKCFDFKQDGCTKIIKALEFGVDLKIDSKLISSKTQTSKEKQYKLFAVVYHDGKEASKGHYVTDAFHIGYSSWLRYDDSSVKTVQEEHVLKPQGTRVPYLLFYRRSDTIRGK